VLQFRIIDTGSSGRKGRMECWPCLGSLRPFAGLRNSKATKPFFDCLPEELLVRLAFFICLHEIKAVKSVSLRCRAAANAASLTTISGQCLYVIGGHTIGSGVKAVSRDCEKYEMGKDAWAEIPPMSVARRCAAAAVASGCIYVLGGTSSDQALKSAERFDAETVSWETLPDLCYSRVWGSAASIAGRVYLCAGSGGMYSPHHYIRTAECFDVSLRRWSELPPMLQGRRCAASAVLHGCLVMCGGSDGGLPLSSAEYFSPDCNRWRPLPPMPSGRRNAACCARGEKLYVIGGEDGVAACDAMMFDASTQVWTYFKANLLNSRWWAVAAVISENLLVCGGTDGAAPLSSAEVYDEEMGMWRPLPRMTRPRNVAVGRALFQRERNFLHFFD